MKIGFKKRKKSEMLGRNVFQVQGQQRKEEFKPEMYVTLTQILTQKQQKKECMRCINQQKSALKNLY